MGSHFPASSSSASDRLLRIDRLHYPYHTTLPCCYSIRWRGNPLASTSETRRGLYRGTPNRRGSVVRRAPRSGVHIPISLLLLQFVYRSPVAASPVATLAKHHQRCTLARAPFASLSFVRKRARGCATRSGACSFGDKTRL
ncbi:hypothetical protein K458DRAFT_127202 [Lentithecium fluviatile CBS 122367]|uniref:Uncharacterized protein n=1 Tax=Lentithecium fluviatile CBS 122367 TaxID=1168545 RepID=A0A6G1JFQ4_9PLEO|nr:hypothetical protein K458DRAFT_127202 [Lentithecium fluviatile CBS 122367]